MKYETTYKNHKIVVKRSQDSDWKDDDGYEVEVTFKGCIPATSWNNYPNAAQALKFAKDEIDREAIPHEREKFLGLF